MSAIKDLYAALAGDTTEVTAVTQAQAELSTKALQASVASTTLTGAQATLTTVQGAVVDVANPTPAEVTAISAAEAAVATATTAKAAAETAVTAARAALTAAQANADTGDTVALAAKLSVTDFGMVSNDQARAILAARGVAVKFEEPVTVNSDYNMNLIG